MKETSLFEAAKYATNDLSFNDDGSINRDLFLVFYDPPKHRWWNSFLMPGYNHVSVIQYDGYEYVYVNHGSGFSHVQVLPVKNNQTDEEIRHHVETLLSTKVNLCRVKSTIIDEIRVKFLLTPWTCVETAKSFLGITNYWMFTPYQLYKHLKKIGAIYEHPKSTKEIPRARTARTGSA